MLKKKPSPQAISFKRFLQKVKKFLAVEECTLEESTFMIYRADTQAVLARGIHGYEAAKSRANQLRKQLKLKWDQVKFKVEKHSSSVSAGSLTRSKRSSYGQQGRMDYSRTINPSKGTRFRGYYDADGNFHDLD